jgi:hypothetical protein
MTLPTKREAANKVIDKMNGEWERLKDLAARAKCGNGKWSLSKMEMARFLHEKEKVGVVEKKLVYINHFGASLQRRVYRKVKTKQ